MIHFLPEPWSTWRERGTRWGSICRGHRYSSRQHTKKYTETLFGPGPGAPWHLGPLRGSWDLLEIKLVHIENVLKWMSRYLGTALCKIFTAGKQSARQSNKKIGDVALKCQKHTSILCFSYKKYIYSAKYCSEENVLIERIIKLQQNWRSSEIAVPIWNIFTPLIQMYSRDAE